MGRVLALLDPEQLEEGFVRWVQTLYGLLTSQVVALRDLAGATITLDALSCQKELVRYIRSQQSDYVLTVKENQPALRAALEETFSVEREAQCKGCPHTAHRTVNGGHGRIEIRRGCGGVCSCPW